MIIGRILRVFLTAYIILHALSLFLVIIQFQFIQDVGSVYSEGKIVQRNFESYITSIYFLITTMTTVGYGDIRAKKDIPMVITYFLEISGIILYGYTMQQINRALQALYAVKIHRIHDRTHFEEWVFLREKSIDIMDRHKVIPRAKQWQSFVINFDIEHIFLSQQYDQIPSKFKDNIMKVCFEQIIAEFSGFFKNFSSNIVLTLINHVRPRLFLKGEVILPINQQSPGIFFLIGGEVCVKHSNDQNLMILSYQKGSFFGEETILTQKVKHTIEAFSERVETLFLPEDILWHGLEANELTLAVMRRIAVFKQTAIDVEEDRWDQAALTILKIISKQNVRKSSFVEDEKGQRQLQGDRFRRFVDKGFLTIMKLREKDEDDIIYVECLKEHTIKALREPKYFHPIIENIRKSLLPSLITNTLEESDSPKSLGEELPKKPLDSRRDPQKFVFLQEPEPEMFCSQLLFRGKSSSSIGTPSSRNISRDFSFSFRKEENLEDSSKVEEFVSDRLISRYFNIDVDAIRIQNINAETSELDLDRIHFIKRLISNLQFGAHNFVKDHTELDPAMKVKYLKPSVRY